VQCIIQRRQNMSQSRAALAFDPDLLAKAVVQNHLDHVDHPRQYFCCASFRCGPCPSRSAVTRTKNHFETNAPYSQVCCCYLNRLRVLSHECCHQTGTSRHFGMNGRCRAAIAMCKRSVPLLICASYQIAAAMCVQLRHADALLVHSPRQSSGAIAMHAQASGRSRRKP
jgi:hypothetical protein